ncbi:hypothetical protein Ae201684P_021615 [Aphanomyces euteiches]|nr:hypothetical protein Ae201684P_021615 [Aphanomyces euteiches]
MSFTQWWCGSHWEWLLGTHHGGPSIGPCVETSVFLAPVWKLGIILFGVYAGRAMNRRPKESRAWLHVMAASLCLLSSISGVLFLVGHKPIYPCQVYAGTLWIVEGFHTAILLLIFPSTLRFFRHLFFLDVITRGVAVYSIVQRWKSHHTLDLNDINVLVDTGILLVKMLTSWLAQRRYNYDQLPHRAQCLETDASLFSQLFFLWIWPLLRQGYRNKSLEMADLPPMHPMDAGDALVERFRLHWRQYPNHSLIRHLHAVVWRPLYYSAALMAGMTVANLANPLLLHSLLECLSQPHVPLNHAVGLAALWILALTSTGIFLHQFWAVAVRCGMHTRSILQQFVFDKALRLSSSAGMNGRVNSLLSVDACRLCDDNVICFLHWDTWSAVATLVTCFYFLFDLLSYSSLVWLGVMALYAPCAAFFGAKIKKQSATHQGRRDDRSDIVTQLLRAALTMKALALDAWSEARVAQARGAELNALQWKALHQTFSTSVLAVALVVAPMLSFIVFIHVQHRELDAATAFSALAWFNTAATPLLRIPMVISTLVDSYVSLSRLEAFFRADERPGDNDKPQSRSQMHLAIELENVQCHWTDAQRPLFRNLTLSVPKGQFLACAGAVGSGKSSFLELCIRLPVVTQGSVRIHGTVAYCPQRPWIQNASIRDNILFGLPMDRTWYKLTIQMCCLQDDVAQWPAGDATLAGEQGCNLSGGQKQRVSLARAVYSRRDILLLDDVLASLDAHVGQQIFQNCLCSPALAYTTKILVVNQPAYLQHPSVDRVLYFEESPDGHYTINPIDPSRIQQPTTEDSSETSSGHGHTSSAATPSAATSTSVVEAQSGESASEFASHGALDSKLILLYLRSIGSGWVVVGYGLVLLVEHFLILASTYCLSRWTEDSQNTSVQTIYVVLGIAQATASLGQKVIFVLLSLTASVELHQALMRALVHASMHFFDSHSQGMLLNRCVKDVASLDETVPYVVSTFLYNTLEIVMSFVSVVATAPAVLLVVLFLIYPYIVVYNMYRWPARDLKRLQSASRSPILAYFNEIAQGTSTIAAFDAGSMITRASMDKIDLSVQSFWPALIANQWVTVWLEFLGLFIVIEAVFGCVYLRAANHMGAGIVGLILTYAAQLPTRLGWMFKMLAALEVEFVALERIDQITAIADFHADRTSTALTIAPPMFHGGVLRIQHMTMAYGPTSSPNIVLHDVHVDIPAGANVAVVGRTGAGKSSFVRALLGLYPIQGSVKLGGVDLSTLSKPVLRTQVLGFVPQDSILLGRTVLEALTCGDSSNADRIGVEKVLAQVGMTDAVLQLRQGVDTPLSEVTFSGGEMQLLCLARALLRPGHVLICDEATAYVDVKTDEAIHRLLVELPRTVITICHRVHHLMEYDLILVLDKGRLVECGSPVELQTQYPRGIFASLIATGS